jgi:tetratricopeptide (TPR) repeat protein
MKKKIIFSIVGLLTSGNILFGQMERENSSKKKSDILFEKKQYELAKKFGDLSVATNSLYGIISIEGEDSPYLDSLLFLYYQNGNIYSAHLVCNELLAHNADNLIYWEIEGFCLEKMGFYKESIEYYQNLFNKKKSIQYGYKLAFLQYNLKRLGEAKQTIDSLNGMQNELNLEVQVPVSKDSVQNIKLEAAVNNLSGMIYFDLNHYNEALLFFNKAIEISPNFIWAIENRKYVIGIMSSVTSPK